MIICYNSDKSVQVVFSMTLLAGFKLCIGCREGAMKNEKLFWGLLLSVSACFIIVFSFFLMSVIYPFHVEQMKGRARETVDHLQYVVPYLSPEARQSYLENMQKKSDELSYLLIMDANGVAVAHSEPSRIGMSFYETGLTLSLQTGQRVEQIYLRDSDNPSSPHYREKTIDIIEPYHSLDRRVAGVVNVGISLSKVERVRHKYLVISLVGALLWVLFISGFTYSHIRSVAQTKQLNAALAESERLLSRAFKATSDAIWEWNLVTGKTYYAPRWYEMLGYDSQELEANFDSFKLLCHPEDLSRVLEYLQFTLEACGSQAFVSEFRMRCKNGNWKWILGRGNVVELDAEGTPVLFAGTNTDISERKQAEKLISESEERYRSIIENIQDVFYRTDKQGMLVLVSPSGVKLLGYDAAEELLGQPNASFWVHPAERDEMLSQIREKGYVRDYEVALKKKDGSAVMVSTNSAYYYDSEGNVQGVEGIFRDISERKHAEAVQTRLREQLVQAQKMEAIGRLAGGVAHDFNNMLVVIMGRAELALNGMKGSEPLYQHLVEIRQAAERSAGLTRQLLAFARKQIVEPRVLYLDEAVGDMLKMHRRLVGEDIEMVWLPGAKDGKVKIDPSQLDQILANLCVNARDAISGAGRVMVQSNHVVITEQYAEEQPGVRPGNYVVLSVSDNGCGMDDEEQKHIFEPFYTTKEIGRGTGLGLSTVFGIVEQNNGFLEVRSQKEIGTTFRIYLPSLCEQAALSDDADAEIAIGNGQTVMLVEDELMIMNMCRTMLEGMNYNVFAYNSPDEALKKARDYDGDIALLITDVVMPKMNGRELAEKLGQLRPGMKFLFMSGYTADVLDRKVVLEQGAIFIQKPFSMNDFASKVHEVLSR